MNSLLLVTMSLGDKMDSAFYNFDMWVYSLFGSIHNDILTAIAKFITFFGSEKFIIPVAVLSIILCIFKKTRKYGFALLLAIMIGTLITNVAIKPTIARVRPYITLKDNPQFFAWYTSAGQIVEKDFSFPSGHTTGAFEIATAIYLCLKSDKKKWAFVFPIFALLVMLSRVYLMVHYPTDVLGGLVVGVVAGLLGYYLMTLIMKLFNKNSKN